VREAIAEIACIASPLGTGWLLVEFGPRVAFGATSVIVILAALPLLWAPDVRVPRHVDGAFRATVPGVLLFAADGWIAAGYALVWQFPSFALGC
jgi:MFS transporter, DHA1 family, inner membrane transport protein